MKKHLRRAIALALCLCLTLPAAVLPALSADMTEEEDGRTVVELKTNAGESTGVTLTTIHYPKSAGTLSNSHIYGKQVTVVEADLSNPHISMRAMTNFNGSSILNTVRSTVDHYMASADGEEILAATNADGFYYTNTGAMGCGALIVDGEIWNTSPYDYSWVPGTAKTTDVSWGGANDYSVGVTDENQPLVGQLRFTTTITNDTKGGQVSAGGVNRNTGSSSLVIYNRRFLNSPYYDNYKTYMLVVETDDPSFGTSNVVKGKITAIYTEDTPNDKRTASLDDHTVIISATGSKISTLKSKFSVGDEISMRTRMTDQMGQTELWNNATMAISGHILVLKDGKAADSNLFANNDVYAVTIAGFNNDGKLMFSTFTADEDCRYGGFTQGDLSRACLELGYNTCFFFDGGGSATMVTKDGQGNNVLTSRYVDNYSTKVPEERRVGSSVCITWSAEPVCEEQGSLSYIKVDESRRISVDPSLVRTAADGRKYFTAADGVSYYVDEKAVADEAGAYVVDLSKVPGATNFPEAGYSGKVIMASVAENAYLGQMDLSQYAACYITYGCDTQNDLTGVATGSGTASVVGLKSDNYPYNGDGDKVDLTADVAHAVCEPVAVNWAAGAKTVAVDLSSVDYSGDVYLGIFTQPYQNGQYHGIAISRVVFATGVSYTYSYLPALSERYTGPLENEETQPETEPVTEPVTEPETTPETQPETSAPAATEETLPVTEPATQPTATEAGTEAAPSGGCSSLVCLCVLPLLLPAAALLRRRKD